jgi:hypothetical protein
MVFLAIMNSFVYLDRRRPALVLIAAFCALNGGADIAHAAGRAGVLRLRVRRLAAGGGAGGTVVAGPEARCARV